MTKKGFTLIELMIVIAIISTLATMAMPSLMDRVIRSQVKESLQLAEMVQQGVDEFYRHHKRLPATNKEAGLPAAEKIIGNFTSKIMVEDGAIHITLGNRINLHASGKVVSLRPAVVKDEPRVPIAWVCGQATVPNGMTSPAANQTTLLSRLLPIECRY